MSNAWVDDLTSEESDDDDSGSTLFADNFERLVEDGAIENLNAETIDDQIGKVDDVDLLEDAIEVDDRDELHLVYEDRIEEIQSPEADDEGDDAEGSQQGATTPSEDSAEEDDPEASADEESSSGSSTEREPSSNEDESDEDSLGAEDELDEAIDEEIAGDELVSEVDEEPEDGGDAEPSDDTDKDDEAQQENPDNADTSDDTGQMDEYPTEGSETDQPDGSDGAEPDVSEEGGLEALNVRSVAPDAVDRTQAAEQDSERTMLVWGEEGTGKTHVAHTAPAPIAYIDTEGKADELAEKFDKPIHYFFPEDFEESLQVLEQAFNTLDKYYEEYGVRGTIVVDSMTVMWEWAQIHHMKKTRPGAESLAEVQWESAFGEGSGDWQSIKAYHNTSFRDPILNSPYNVVFTAGRKEDYNFTEDNDIEQMWKPDGEKHNAYNVKEVVNLYVGDDGTTLGDLHKAAKTRYSFLGLEWPEWDDIYEAIRKVHEAEQADEEIDITAWDFEVVDGKPQYVVEDDNNDDE
jgi:hypothetical protein